ncbi:protein SCAR2 [Vigna radiata var. radiata]|uniref:Protein SCAR n=1 Tax=Vigna radiata var. radiata TaxID=3916 RepID=A0A1S3THB1_VIGRR|nr:protein SCAR2 [Vigna radiata var. radiata]
MPLCRHHIRSAHALTDPELYRAADSDDSEALLEAVAMAGLVGFLRQLGDLAQFAAEMFHDLHEEVIATAARGRSLISRVQQLEAEVPALEKVFLTQTHHSSTYTNGGIEWHPNLRSEHNLVTRGDLPRFIMDSYEESRGPPRLFLLDKFDVAGAGACLKRYTDPSFFTVKSASSGTATAEVQREKKIRKIEPKKGTRQKNGETPEVVPSHAKLHELFLEERIENACRDPARLVKLKTKQLNGSAVEKTGKSYMGKILEIHSPDHKLVCETSIIPQPGKLVLDDSESGIKTLEISSIAPLNRSLGNENLRSTPNEQKLELNPYTEMYRETGGYMVEVNEQISGGVSEEMSSNYPNLIDKEELVLDELKKRECSLDSYHSDDVTSEVDDYMDALATMESELETDNEYGPMKSLLNIENLTDSNGKGEPQMQAQFSDSQSFGDSSTSEENSSSEQDRIGEHNEAHGLLLDFPSTGTSWESDDNSSFTRVRNVEHSQSQVQFSDFQSMENSTSQIEDMPSNQLLPNLELQTTYCREFFMNDDAHVRGETISDSIPVSSGLIDSGHSLMSYDLGAASPASLPAQSQSDETPSGPAELNLRIEEDEEKECLVESIVTKPEALYPIRDDACPVVSFDNNPSNNLNVCDPYVHYNALFQVSNELNLANEGECGDHSEIEVMHEESLNEYSSEMLGSEYVDIHGEDPICPSVEVDLNPSTKLLLDGRDLKSEDDIIATQLNSEDLVPAAKTTPKCSLTKELGLDFTHGYKPDLPEIEVLHLDQQGNFEQVPSILGGEEISVSTCSLDLVGDDGNTEHPSSDIITSPMSNLTKLEEPLSIFADPHEEEMIVNEADSRESLTELAAQKVVDQVDIASTEFPSDMNRSVPCDPPDSGMWNNIRHSSLEKIQYSSSIYDLKALPVCLELDPQRSSDQRINPTIHVMDPLAPLISGFLHKAAKSNLEEMPPMPPLPPMQWRSVKIQHASLVTLREEASLASLQPIQPNKPDDKSQFGLSTFEKESRPSQNLFLPDMAMQSNKHQYSSPVSVGISEHPVAIPLQFPVMLNEASGQQSFLVPEQSQIQNPFLALRDRPPLGYVVDSEGEKKLNSSPHSSMLPAVHAISGADSIFQQEKPTQSPSQLTEGGSLEVKMDRPGELHLVLRDGPLSPKEKPAETQLMEETGLEVKIPKQSSMNLEGRMEEDTSISPLSPPSPGIGQSKHSMPPSEGEMAFPLEASGRTEMPHGKPKNKRVLPQDPVIDPVAALDKSRLRKVTERVMPPRAATGDERDSLLEMIRTKSFNLRPAAVNRPPSIGGPKTNLRVAAILEKANAIRQALAGSDEDDDADSWSDS